MSFLPYIIAAIAGLVTVWLITRGSNNQYDPRDMQFPDYDYRDDHQQILQQLINGSTPDGPQSSIQRVKSALNKMDEMIAKIKYSKAQSHISRTKVGTVKEETDIPTDTILIRPMINVNEVTKVMPSQMGLDDDFFYAKLTKRDLLVRKFEGTKDVYKSLIKSLQQILVVLVDCSGSMDGVRIDYATELVGRLVRMAQEKGVRIIVIPFSSQPFVGTMTDADEPHEYEQLHREIQNLNKFSGGTDIDIAIHAGIDVFEELESYTDGQILLTTDGTEGINSKRVVQRLREKELKLHTLCIGEYHAQLEKVSANFDYVDLPAN